MPARSLPARPNLDQLKRQADELHQAHRDRDPSAAARIAAHHPGMRGKTPDDVLERPVALADAQLAIAREYGFRSWADLKHHVESIERLHGFAPHPRFAEALAALDAGDLDRLRTLLVEDPALVHARTNLEPPYGYFSGATLLHHVAGNPDRGIPLPGNIAEVAQLLITAGADVHARTLGPNGGDTLGLLVTSRRASDQNVSGPLIDVLVRAGARLDVTSDGVLDGPLANHAPRAAEKMIELGAKPDLLAAAALGRLDLLQASCDSGGRLIARPRRGGREMSERDAIGLAMLFAYVRKQREAVAFLLDKDGNWDVTGVNNGTALHRAAGDGDLEIVRRLVEKGADTGVRDPIFAASPLAWADHNNQAHVVEWMRAHTEIDLHDAVWFGFTEHVERRLREDPRSVNARRDQREIPQATPLHVAVAKEREDLVKRLLDAGADLNALAGNGVTALDIADYQGATAIISLLENRGAQRSAQAEKPSGDPKLKPFERLANDVLEVYRTESEEAVNRLRDFFQTRTTAWDIRRAVRVRLQKGRTSGSEEGPPLTLAGARDTVAGVLGWSSWAELAHAVTHLGRTWAKPLYVVDESQRRLEIRRPVGEAEWEIVIGVLAERKLEALNPMGQMTDAALARIASLDHVRRLELEGSSRLTDQGLRHLARMPGLQHLNLSGTGFTNRGLEVLRQLPDLRVFELHWHSNVTDEGLAHLEWCERLEQVDLLGSPVGDGVIAALAGKRHLWRLKTGTRVTDAALPLLHRLPMFKTWAGGEPRYSLMSAEAGGPTHLMLDGPFTDAGLAGLRGLDGLFGLSFFWHSTAFTPAGLAALISLPHLGFLGCEGERCTDEAMRWIGEMPNLRMLQAQGTVASDAGFEALSRSSSLEYLWGRECPNLTGRGFRALAGMPSLRGLAVDLACVDDDAIAALAESRTLREIVPVNAQDPAFRHIGRCERLESLWCMYCRETTDAATEGIAGLPALRTYYAGQTKITDRSLAILGGMHTLEKLEFWNCAGITDEGAAMLAALPRLREVTFDGCRRVTAAVAGRFSSAVRVRLS